MESRNEFILKVLKGVDLFSILSDAALRKLAGLFTEKLYKQDEVIFEEGSKETSLLLVAHGEVRITQQADTQSEEALKVLHQGDIFGEMALIEDLPRSATAIAQIESILLTIEKSDFFQFLETDPASGVKILLSLARILSARLRDADAKLKTFVHLTQWI